MKSTYLPAGRSAARLVLTPEEMQAADHHAIATLGIPGVALMENAGRQVALVATEFASAGAVIAVVCGRGNNGGDGLVAARHLTDWGHRVEVILVAPDAGLSVDAALHLAVVEAMGLPVHRASDLEAFDHLGSPGTHGLVVDALLGTGLRGEVRGLAAEAIAWMNGQGAPVVAVDTPSGLCGETGRPLGSAVRATATVAFSASRLGHWLYPGPEYVGELRVVDIGLPEISLRAAGATRRVLGDADLAPAFARRPGDAHKGTLGHVYVLAGSPGRTGAARLCCDAAMRGGAGLVTLGTTRDVLPALGAQLYEVMAEVGFEPGVPGGAEALARRLDARQAVVVGPGMPTDEAHRAFLRDWLPRLTTPAVVDADALNHLATAPEVLRRGGPKILTPHPGEAARLLGTVTADVQADRPGAALQIARRTGAVTVLKGAHTLVADPDGALAVCPDGNPGMATAGMGDVLAGLLGALLARGLSPGVAARAGVLWHARAGDRAAAQRGEAGLRARDVIAATSAIERHSCSRV